jgi:Probable Zinc-ribbon domain
MTVASFASHYRSERWVVELNGRITPRMIAKASDTIHWFNCCDCGHDFDAIISGVVRNDQWCGYCTNRKRCDDPTCQHCFNNSFASHFYSKNWVAAKNNGITPRQVARSTQDPYWFNCPKCTHAFSSPPAAIVAGNGCGYCHGNLRCGDGSCVPCFIRSFASCAKSRCWHPKKNGTVTPRQIAMYDNNKYWFICDECTCDFSMKANHVAYGHWCPCAKNKTEAILHKWLLSVTSSLNVVKGAYVDWCRNPDGGSYLPLDFLILDLRLVIELDGRQHWEQVARWTHPEETQRRDLYKMEQARKQGLTVVLICQEEVFGNRYDWRAALLPHLKLHEQPARILLDNGAGIYKRIGYEL